MTLTDELETQTEPEEEITPPVDDVTPEPPEEPEPPAPAAGYTPDARAKWEAMSEEERREAYEASQRAIGQFDEDRAVGKLYREGKLQSTPDPEPPAVDHAAVQRQQTDAVIEQIATSDDMLDQLAAEGFDGEQLQEVARKRARAQYNLMAPLMAQNQQLAGIVNNLLSDQALTKDIQRFIPKDQPVAEADAVEELRNMVGGPVNYTDWSNLPPMMQGLMGELAARRAAAKPKKKAEEPATQSTTRRTVTPEPVFNVKQNAAGGNVRPTVQDPRVAAKITELTRSMGTAVSAAEIEELAIEDIAYRDRYNQ